MPTKTLIVLQGLKGGKLETTGASINRGFVTPRFGVSVLKQAYCIGTGKSTNHLENRQAVQLWEAGGGALEGGCPQLRQWGRAGQDLRWQRWEGVGRVLKGLFSLLLCVA